MQLYIGLISKDETGRPEACNKDDYIKVRIPEFHGPKNPSLLTGTKAKLSDAVYSDYELPWALISRSIDNKNFSATQFNEDELVYVVLENENINSPIILGYASRFDYNENMNIANANIFSESSTVVAYKELDNAKSFIDIVKSFLGFGDED